jgi:hypothetical protein
MCTDDDVLAAKRYAEFMEIDGLRLEGVRLEGIFW